MATRITSPEGRKAALQEASLLVKSGTNDADIERASELMEAVNTFDQQSKGSALLNQISTSAPRDGDSGNLYLDFAAKSFGEEIMKAVRPEGQKALVVGGSQIVGTPLVSSDPVTLGRPVQSFLQVIPTIKRAPVYSFLRQTVRTANAGVVAPGATKPTSVFTLASVEKRLKIIATLSEPVNRYDLDDNSNLRTFVQNELQYALRLALEDEVLNGDGTGEHFTGIKNTSGISLYTAPVGQTDDLVSYRKALATYETTGEIPQLLIVNPTDWANLVVKRNSSGNFDLGGAIDEDTRKAWGVPVALSGLVPANTAYILGEGAATISTDAVVHLEWDSSSGFSNNTLLARAETRAEVDVIKPSAITKLTLVDA